MIENRQDDLTITRPEFLSEDSDEKFRSFIYSLLISSVQMEKLREQIGGLIGVNGIQYHILTVIAEKTLKDPLQGQITVGDVARTLQAGATHITMETGKLAKRGLLEKTPNPEDRRSILLTLSDKGRAALRSLAPSRQEINNTIFDGFNKDEFERFHKLISKMVGTTSKAIVVADKIKAEQSMLGTAA
ncbi:MAG: winged helix DNA-binding protein [Rhodospirillales bacterium]